MAGERLFADVIEEYCSKKQRGALYISVVETSEDLIRIYFKDGVIYHMRYGSAIGKDCLDILEYYTLYSATFFDGIPAPDKPASDLPTTGEIIAAVRRQNKKVKMR